MQDGKWPNVKRIPGTKHVLTIPRWLGGSWTASYLVRHAWTRRLILAPLIKWQERVG